MEPAIRGEVRAEDVVCRFDYTAKRDGSPVSDGLGRRLKKDVWHVSSRPPGEHEGESIGPDPAPDQLDFCLMRLETSVGTERLAGSSDAAVPLRGWFNLKERQSVGQNGQQLFIWQHPQGAVLKLAIGDQLKINGSGNRFSYNVNTLKGSSGAPVFNAAMELIGLHHSGQNDAIELAATGKSNEGIPISNIARLTRQRGMDLRANEQIAPLRGDTRPTEPLNTTEVNKPPAPGPITHPDDIQRGRWGNLSERDGRKAEVIVEDVQRELFYFSVIVSSTDGSPLQGPIIFHLHQTYRPRSIIPIRRIHDGTWARLEEYSAEGTFTIGIQVKQRNQKWTSLEVDLSTITTLPTRFRTR
jgi:hypothetical protein